MPPWSGKTFGPTAFISRNKRNGALTTPSSAAKCCCRGSCPSPSHRSWLATINPKWPGESRPWLPCPSICCVSLTALTGCWPQAHDADSPHVQKLAQSPDGIRAGLSEATPDGTMERPPHRPTGSPVGIHVAKSCQEGGRREHVTMRSLAKHSGRLAFALASWVSAARGATIEITPPIPSPRSKQPTQAMKSSSIRALQVPCLPTDQGDNHPADRHSRERSGQPSGVGSWRDRCRILSRQLHRRRSRPRLLAIQRRREHPGLRHRDHRLPQRRLQLGRGSLLCGLQGHQAEQRGLSRQRQWSHGGTEDSEITVEFCEFDRNGNLSASTSAPSHNIYIYGGTFTLRYSYAHDPIQGQNFHIRAHDAVIEYTGFRVPSRMRVT